VLFDVCRHRDRLNILQAAEAGALAPIQELANGMIDHTLVDVVIVDEGDRLPIGRPWLTLAIDVASRAVLRHAAHPLMRKIIRKITRKINCQFSVYDLAEKSRVSLRFN
jgi:transposase InsO family protein